MAAAQQAPSLPPRLPSFLSCEPAHTLSPVMALYENTTCTLAAAEKGAANLVSELGSGAPSAAWNATSYPDALAAYLASGAPPAAGNDATFRGFLVPPLGNSAASASWNAMFYPSALPAHLGCGAAPAAWSGATCPGVLRTQVGSGASSVTWNARSYPGVVVDADHLGSAAPPVVYSGLLVPPLGNSEDSAAWNAAPNSDALEAHLRSGANPAIWNVATCPVLLVPQSGSGAPLATWNATSYPDMVAQAHLGSVAPPVAGEGAEYSGLLVPPLGNTEAWNAMPNADVLAAHIGSGATPAAWNATCYPGVAASPLGTGAAYAELLVPPPGDHAPSAAWNAMPYPYGVKSHQGSGVPPDSVAHHKLLGVVTSVPDAGVVSYTIDARGEGPADFRSENIHHIRIAAAGTDEDGGDHYDSGMVPLPIPAQAVADGRRGGAVTGGFTERLRRGLPVLGIAAASLAVTGLAAGVAASTPATAFGLFTILLGGLSLATNRVLRA